jgi:hypothetical protein
MSENESGGTDLGGDILGVAKKVASVGDRWFISFVRGLGRAAGHLRKETNIVTSSARSAAATTGRVTAKMASRIRPRVGSASPSLEKAGGGTADDLLATVAAHYAVAEDALRSNPKVGETIERLHRLGSPGENQAAAEAPSPAPRVAEASPPGPAGIPKPPAPRVAGEASAGDTIPTTSFADEGQEAADSAGESEAETVARRSRRRRGPNRP